jgi:phenylacetate-CoA ligase
MGADRHEDVNPDGGHAALRRRHVADFEAMLPEYLGRIDWTADRVADERGRALRALLAIAVARSPWHRERLAAIDPGGFSEPHVASLPVMTKTDLMDNFDQLVTDPRLTRELCERHLEEAAADAYLLDQYRVVASGGSSGQRGVFVYGWDAWAICWASMARFPQRDWASDPALAGVRRVAAVVGASKATHVSAAFRRTFSTDRTPEHLIPVSQPLERIVDGLNQLQPTELIGYSSMLPRLAREAQAGRLRISPRRVMAISEPLLPEARPQYVRHGMSRSVTATECRRESSRDSAGTGHTCPMTCACSSWSGPTADRCRPGGRLSECTSPTSTTTRFR